MTLAAYFFGSLAVGATAYAPPLMPQTPTAADLTGHAPHRTKAEPA